MPEATAAPSSPLRVLVTGAGHSIGLGIARRFLLDGARVVLHTRSGVVEGDIDGFADRALVISGDFTVESDIERVVNRAAEHLGGLDTVVANVGGLVGRVPLAEMTVEHWRLVMDLNALSTMLTLKHALPSLRASDRASAVTLASLAAHNGGGAGTTAYAAAKAAIVGFTKAAAKELGPEGIRVNAVAPGFIGETRFHDTFSPPEAQERMIANTALSRAGTTEDVAALVAFLAGEDASFITGETVDINGGQWFR